MENRAVLATWVASALAAALIMPTLAAGSSVYLYLYGATWCPYCRTLDQFLSRAYAGSYYFCKIDVFEACKSSLEAIKSFLVSRGASSEYLGYIPQTYVVRDGRYLIAIVIGGITDHQFWKNITGRSPREKVLLVVSPNVYEIPMTLEEQYELVIKYISAIAATSPPSPGQSPGLHVITSVALIVSGVLVIAYAVFRRRR